MKYYRYDDIPVLTKLGSYKPEKFYWEIIISFRKVAVVALSVFGAELGPQRQCQIALLILLGCLALEVASDPYREVTPAHSVLRKLELSSLLLEWITLWCGLMIYQSDPEPGSEYMNNFMTIFVVICNMILMFWFLSVLLESYVKLKCFGPKSRMKRLMKFLSVMGDKAKKGSMSGEVKLVENPATRVHELVQIELVGGKGC